MKTVSFKIILPLFVVSLIIVLILGIYKVTTIKSSGFLEKLITQENVATIRLYSSICILKNPDEYVEYNYSAYIDKEKINTFINKFNTISFGKVDKSNLPSMSDNGRLIFYDSKGNAICTINIYGGGYMVDSESGILYKMRLSDNLTDALDIKFN